MENKDLIWKDIILQWPNKDYIFLDTSKNVDNLKELKDIFCCETIKYTILNDAEPAKVLFFKNTGELRSINCKIEIFYPKRIQKVKMNINNHQRIFTEEDNIWN